MLFVQYSWVYSFVSTMNTSHSIYAKNLTINNPHYFLRYFYLKNHLIGRECWTKKTKISNFWILKLVTNTLPLKESYNLIG